MPRRRPAIAWQNLPGTETTAHSIAVTIPAQIAGPANRSGRARGARERSTYATCKLNRVSAATRDQRWSLLDVPQEAVLAVKWGEHPMARKSHPT